MDLDPTTLTEIFSNPLAMVTFLTGLVKILRDAFPAIAGKIVTVIVTVLVGAAVGAFGDGLGLLAYQALIDMPSVLGGVVYGSLAAIGGFVGVNVVDMLFERKAKAEAGADSPSVGE